MEHYHVCTIVGKDHHELDKLAGNSKELITKGGDPKGHPAK